MRLGGHKDAELADKGAVLEDKDATLVDKDAETALLRAQYEKYNKKTNAARSKTSNT